ncbi:MAG: hypothetical protein GY839_04335 [candidate division Zixibacteria bacterium]|nr:hypothetical protein [candidate division Zixibacteria bacterium]
MNIRVYVIIVFISFLALSSVNAQGRTMGLLLNEEDAFVGYTLFAPMSYNVTYLIDNNGLLVHSWQSLYGPKSDIYLLENGSLLRTTRGSIVQEIDWDGFIVWEFDYSSIHHYLHHDIEYLPNGNVLMIAAEFKTREEAIGAGRSPYLIYGDTLQPDYIVEVEPDGQYGGNIVWEWHIWDHLVQDFDSTKANYGVVAEHPELMDINFLYFIAQDWNHTNSVQYNPELDQVVLSLHQQNELIVIDHSTTTEEAAGHSGGNYGKGGDFLYRWGNPLSYRAGTEEDRKFFNQHDARWIEPGYPGEGNLMVFNNGQFRPEGSYSTIDEIVPPVDSAGNYILNPGSAHEPEEQVWTYTAENPFNLYSPNISGAHRLPNGNTLICSGLHGMFYEVTPGGEVVWQYINPVSAYGPMNQGDAPFANSVFRIHRYAPDYPGLVGRDLTPGDPIEIYRNEYLPGDVNMYNGAWPPSVIGGDVTYLVNYFRSLPSSQACLLDGFWCSADANGDCDIIGSDVTRLVTYFRGTTTLAYCPDYEPAWSTPDDLPEEAPIVWPNCE